MRLERNLKLIVLTDLHIVPAGKTILGISPIQRLAAAVDHINAHNRDADRVIVTGDIAHIGDSESYRIARDALDRLAMPKSVLVGNHDRRERFVEVFDDASLDAHGFVQSVIDIGNWRLVSLDTLNGPPYNHREIHHGLLCGNRLRWLENALAGAEGRHVLIFMHHPPHEVGFRGMDGIRLKNETAFFDLLHRYRNVRHIVSGHIHRTISGTAHGIGFSVFKSPVHQQPMTFDSHDTSASIAEPAAYGIIFASPTSIVAHTEDYEISASLPIV